MSNSKGGGVIQATASEATFVALLAARTRAVNERLAEEKKSGVDITDEDQKRFEITSKLVGYTSSQAHTSVTKAFMLAGIPTNHLRKVRATLQTDFAVDVEDLKEQIARDKAAGLIPFFVCATVGKQALCWYQLCYACVKSWCVCRYHVIMCI